MSFKIQPGQTIAIVGHTGAGKTTIISLLLRFYDVQRGAIQIDGVDIREMSLDDLRGASASCCKTRSFQRHDRREHSPWHARIQDAAIEQAAEDVNAADFIRGLPAGFQEMLRERGNTLSTGQKQLISFARALAHDPRILILDEATSSVDTETEVRVREALTRMVKGAPRDHRHRLSTIQRADKIVVMHKGQVREIGSHQELLAQRGIYWKLYICR